jgi:hypothetical protein
MSPPPGLVISYLTRFFWSSSSYSSQVCPTFVNKNNWATNDDYGDAFGVATTTNGGSTTVTARRVDADNGWGMGLTFKCAAAETRFGPTPFEVTIGGSGGREKWVAPSLPAGQSLSCGKAAYKRNWLGGESYGDYFTIETNSDGRQVRAHREDQDAGWGMNLRVMCYTMQNYYRSVSGVGGWGGTCTCPDGQTYEVGDNGDNCGSIACEGGVAGTCSEGGISSANQGKKVTCRPGNYYRKVNGVGGWGGMCTCPDGKKYQVGDNGDGCASLACEGGVSSGCTEGGILNEYQGYKVTCANPTPAPTAIPTIEPTHLPTHHPCDDESHGCDLSTAACTADGDSFTCECKEGFVTDAASTTSCTATPAPTAQPTLIPTAVPSQHPTYATCPATAGYNCDLGSTDCLVVADGATNEEVHGKLDAIANTAAGITLAAETGGTVEEGDAGNDAGDDRINPAAGGSSFRRLMSQVQAGDRTSPEVVQAAVGNGDDLQSGVKFTNTNIPGADRLTCPHKVDRNNWLDTAETYGDWFSTETFKAAESSQNFLSECGNQCGSSYGFCDYCGDGGKCCLQGWAGNGCSGDEGSSSSHRCVGSGDLTWYIGTKRKDADGERPPRLAVCPYLYIFLLVFCCSFIVEFNLKVPAGA